MQWNSFTNRIANAWNSLPIQIIEAPTLNSFNSSEQKKFADNYRFDENARKLSKRVENTVGIWEIAGYEQFLLFLQHFRKSCFADM